MSEVSSSPDPPFDIIFSDVTSLEFLQDPARNESMERQNSCPVNRLSSDRELIESPSHPPLNLIPKLSYKEVLSNLNFKIQKGELIAVIGPVGAGKSSLLTTILG